MRYTVEVNEYGTFWFKEGTDILHREDGPAVEYLNGTKEWCLNGKFHREDGPAFENLDGDKYWYLNGKRHREVGPCTMCKDCLKGNFELCSKPGPAIEYPNGIKEWFLKGKHHRIDGPAVEYPDGYKVWYLNGEQYSSEQEYRKALDNLNNTCDNKVIEWFDGKKYELVPVEKD